MPDMTQANKARLEKALSKLYNFDGNIQTLGEFLNSHELTRRSKQTRNHEEKRRDLEYKPCKPVTSYALWYMKDGNEFGLSVPKIVYDLYDLPETIIDATY